MVYAIAAIFIVRQLVSDRCKRTLYLLEDDRNWAK